MKARSLVKKGESAIVVFTHGEFFDSEAGTTGYWVIRNNIQVDKVIIYLRKSSKVNEIYTSEFIEVTPARKYKKRFVIHSSAYEFSETTESNWIEFAEGGTNPIRYIYR